MSVFLRWGVFGIIAVAALLYAYNASKRLSERHASQQAPAVSEEPAEEPEEADAGEATDDATDNDEEQDTGVPAAPDMPEACEEEQQVAERALKMRRDGEPLDRLLRIDLIVLQPDPNRGERLKAVATRWFEREGRDPNAATLRAEVLRDCRNAGASSAP